MRRSRRTVSADRRSTCPIACALDLVGDRWTLLIIRDLLRGLSKYGEFASGPEGVPTNILAERLQRLEDAGVVSRTPYQMNPPRYAYALTEKGRELKAVLAALGMWAVRNVSGTRPDEELMAMLKK